MLFLVPGSLELLLPGATSRSTLNAVTFQVTSEFPLPKHFLWALQLMERGINQTDLGKRSSYSIGLIKVQWDGGVTQH